MRARLVLFFLLFLLRPVDGQAEVFKYTDKNGAISFTDNIENVPEDQRPNLQEAAPPPLQKVEMPAYSETGSDRWIDHPLSKYVIVFIILSIGMLYIQYNTESFLLRLATKFLFVAFLGAAIYSVLVAQEKPITPAAFQKAAEPFVPTPRPIHQAQEAVKKMEEAQKQQEAAIEALMRSTGE
ncbi:MAG: DUF4124 domain-containing protein [Candidatus Manganitrophus sp.]|nr:DUF4124 domain-containing protein [Candidatus Manganitrophus sp.]MDC4226161.1 DUF4124 domain-containing protein [Candidatus Manganitrophus sp.]WDT72598.1 MAG: DUF4124 domain-containing protein [Candidatus Manganitrophus sp.]